MRAFARLLDCLAYTQSRNRKVALLGHYFRSAPDPDRGWALASLTDGVPIRMPLRRMLSDLVRTCNGRLTAAEALGHREFVMTKLYRSA